ncbi:fimbrial protein [Vogesella sp. LIG4]|uniref:fimbrial protein n=1 Tax=Vogesella sp. LIG4 TaxID=1192162 RepID=UPI000820169D|nr:fimbrial protein [Vogesella sp. LIG4]SCK16998.1 major type 1 subunit fimbrin (pilin) [Vogesella sp. LIG4]
MKHLATALAIGLTLTTAAAYATDGTITINGNLIANTCTINGGNGDITVNLPTLSAATLSSAGKTAGSTKFTITLSNCSATSAKTFFEAGATINGNSGNLINNGTAANVEVQFLNDQGQAINLATQANSQQVNITNQAANLNYQAQYFATAAATPGTVSTSVKYSISYN